MNTPYKSFFISPLRSGTASVECWANIPDSEIVAHLYIDYPDRPPSTEWVLSHRRTGLRINNLAFENKDTALSFASKIENLDGFKLIGVEKIEAGPKWNAVDAATLAKEVFRLYEEWC